MSRLIITLLAALLTTASLLAQIQQTVVPLTDTAGTYLNIPGGLYGNRSNTHPVDHAAVGLARTANIIPRDTSGLPSTNGRIVFMSIGISNLANEFCSGNPVCIPESFTGQAAVHPQVNHTSLVIVNGAMGGQVAPAWYQEPYANGIPNGNYPRIANLLASMGLSEKQVTVIWLKVANYKPTASLPLVTADSYVLQIHIGNILRMLMQKYPNLQHVYLTSRSYAGYAVAGSLNPEPMAYESAYPVRDTILAQVNQNRPGGVMDSRSGDLSYAKTPWVTWGPYLWANGAMPNADGLTMLPMDYEGDMIHENRAGVAKIVATSILPWWLGSEFAASWFRAGAVPSPPPPTPVMVTKMDVVARLAALRGAITDTYVISELLAIEAMVIGLP